MVRFTAAICIAMGILTFGCTQEEPARKSATEVADSIAAANLPIEQVMHEYTDSLMSFPGVVGVDIGEQNGKPCITVAVVEKTSDVEGQIPKTLGGYPVRVEETGDFRSDDDSIPPGD